MLFESKGATMNETSTNPVIQAMIKTRAFRDEEEAALVLKASVLALRDRLPEEEALKLGNYLPVSMREYYFKDWNRGFVHRSSNKSEFLAEVSFYLDDDLALDDLVPIALSCLLKTMETSVKRGVERSLPLSLSSVFDGNLSAG